MFKRILILLLVCAVLMSGGSCKKYYAGDITDDETANETPGSENTDDYIWNNSDIVDIAFNGTSINADDAGVTVSGSFSGNGALVVKANYEDGISSKDGLLINSGKIDVTSADDGIRGKDYVIMRK